MCVCVSGGVNSVCISWQMTAVGITENVKGDVKKFEIWYSGREEVYVVQVRSRRKVECQSFYSSLNPL